MSSRRSVQNGQGAQNARNAAIAAAAERFVRAHAELEVLAQRIGPEAASQSELNDRVIALHVALELLILGAPLTPGQLSSSSVKPAVGCYRCEHPDCDGSVGLVHSVTASPSERLLEAIEAAAIMLRWARIEGAGKHKLYCSLHALDTVCSRCRTQECVCPGGPSLDRILMADVLTS